MWFHTEFYNNGAFCGALKSSFSEIEENGRIRIGRVGRSILRCDWLPERASWSYLARTGLRAVSRKKNVLESHKINPLLTKLVRSRWLNIGLLFFFCEVMDRDEVSVHKHAKEELGQYPAILTWHLVNNPFISPNDFSTASNHANYNSTIENGSR